MSDTILEFDSKGLVSISDLETGAYIKSNTMYNLEDWR